MVISKATVHYKKIPVSLHGFKHQMGVGHVTTIVTSTGRRANYTLTKYGKGLSRAYAFPCCSRLGWIHVHVFTWVRRLLTARVHLIQCLSAVFSDVLL